MHTVFIKTILRGKSYFNTYNPPYILNKRAEVLYNKKEKERYRHVALLIVKKSNTE